MNPEDVALLNKFLHRTVKMMTDGTVDIQKQQLDPKSPLHSILAFRDLRLYVDNRASSHFVSGRSSF